jgi:hypothetical protein
VKGNKTERWMDRKGYERAGKSSYRAKCPDCSLGANGQKGDFVKRALWSMSRNGFKEDE